MIQLVNPSVLRFALLSSVTSLGTWLHAQQPLSLEKALSQARNHPIYQASLQRVEALRAKLSSAGRRPDPILETEIGTASVIEGSGDHLVSVRFSQTWERGGKRQLRKRMAEAQLQQAKLEAEGTLRKLMAAIHANYLDLLELQEKRNLVETHRNEVQEILSYDEVRVGQGEIPTLNLEYLKAELSRLDLMKGRLAAQYQTARRRLNGLMRTDLQTEYTLIEGPPEIRLPPLDQSLKAALANSPEVRQLRISLDQSQIRIDMERASGKQDWEWGLGYRRFRAGIGGQSFRPEGLLGSATVSTNLLDFRLRIPLPLGNGDSGNIDSALAARRALERELMSRESLIKESVIGSYDEVRYYRSSEELYRQRLMPQLESSCGRLEAAYKLTGENLLDLIVRRRERLQTALGHVETAFAARRVRVELEKIGGLRGMFPLQPRTWQRMGDGGGDPQERQNAKR